jgi:hypothetical protein
MLELTRLAGLATSFHQEKPTNTFGHLWAGIGLVGWLRASTWLLVAQSCCLTLGLSAILP